MCKLCKVIYCLKQAPWAWYHELCQFFLDDGFTNPLADTLLFVLHTGNHLLYLLGYVDDIINLTGSNPDLVNQFVDCFAHRFSLKDLGPLFYFLGVKVYPHN